MTPGDSDILDLLGRGGWSPTFFIRDCLREKGFGGVTTSQLRLQLEQLLETGAIVRSGQKGKDFKWKLNTERRE